MYTAEKFGLKMNHTATEKEVFGKSHWHMFLLLWLVAEPHNCVQSLAQSTTAQHAHKTRDLTEDSVCVDTVGVSSLLRGQNQCGGDNSSAQL